MNLEGSDYIIVIIAICTVSWLINNWIRAKHGYALEDEWGGKTNRAEDDRTLALASENRELRDLLGGMGERLKVLERIVTDRGYDVSTQIEALRDERQLSPLDKYETSPRDKREREKLS